MSRCNLLRSTIPKWRQAGNLSAYGGVWCRRSNGFLQDRKTLVDQVPRWKSLQQPISPPAQTGLYGRQASWRRGRRHSCISCMSSMTISQTNLSASRSARPNDCWPNSWRQCPSFRESRSTRRSLRATPSMAFCARQRKPPPTSSLWAVTASSFFSTSSSGPPSSV